MVAGVRGREGGGSCKNTHPHAHNTSIKRLIGIHERTDGERWKYTLKIQTGGRLKGLTASLYYYFLNDSS